MNIQHSNDSHFHSFNTNEAMWGNKFIGKSFALTTGEEISSLSEHFSVCNAPTEGKTWGKGRVKSKSCHGA